VLGDNAEPIADGIETIIDGVENLAEVVTGSDLDGDGTVGS